MTKLNEGYRHGDLALIKIEEIPKGLKETKTKDIMRGSNNNAHSFSKGKIYLKEKGDFTIGYFEAMQGCKLYHVEHGKVIKGQKLREANIQKGFYELRRQCEDTNEGMKQVID